MADGIEFARRAAEWAGRPLAPEQEERLEAYAGWLRTEAIPAGGLGPREGGRLWKRHIADSLTFAVAWKERPPPQELLDVGSGVGLPGIPLAVLWPECYVRVLDRGGRRIRLLSRVVRILALEHVLVEHADIFSVADEWESLTFRGAVKAAEAVGLSSRLLGAGGTSVLGLSRQAAPPPQTPDLEAIAAAMGLEPELTEVPAEILDGPAWLLIMRRP